MHHPLILLFIQQVLSTSCVTPLFQGLEKLQQTGLVFAPPENLKESSSPILLCIQSSCIAELGWVPTQGLTSNHLLEPWASLVQAHPN